MTAFQKGVSERESVRFGKPQWADDHILYRSIWRNSLSLTAALSIMTVGLGAALSPFIREHLLDSWPGTKTFLILLMSLSLTVSTFIASLARRQRRIIELHKEFQQEALTRRIRQHANRLRALTNISHIISVETDLQSIFDSIAKMCVETFCCYRASLMLYDCEQEDLVVRSVCGHSDVEILHLRQRLGEGIAGYAAQHREPLLLSSPSDYAKYPGLEYKDPTLTSAMVVPIIVRDELVGVLNVSSRSEDIVYETEDLLALQGLASSAGACIRHTEHVNWMRKMVPHLAGLKAPSTHSSR